VRNLPEILQGLPRWTILLAVPATAFVLATVVAFGLGGDGGDDPAPAAPERLTVQNLDVAPSPTVVQPTPTAPNRKDCNAIRGTSYESGEEREWFLANCLNQATAAGGGGGGGGGGGAPAAATGGGPVSGVEFALGDRLVIDSISVNATVTGATVGPEGSMPDPKGYFNAVWYDFKSHPGIGGYTDGNLVLAAHVDCARCHDGASGLALFYYVKNLAAGARIQYFSHDGTVSTYAVRSVSSYSPGADWGAILSTSAADMTLITCGGTWDAAAHEYSIRWAVYADKVG